MSLLEGQTVGYACTPETVTPSQFEDLFNLNNLLPSDPAYFRIETGFGNERVSSVAQFRTVEYRRPKFSCHAPPIMR